MNIESSWFPVGIDSGESHVRIRKISKQQFERVPFHDGRDEFLQNVCRKVSYQEIISDFDMCESSDIDRVILHQSFCGSTFLAKLLTISGKSASYREPQVLIDLSETKDAPPKLPAAILSWFRKSPNGESRAFVKPSNWANPYLVSSEVLSNARLVLIDIDLADYLVANLRGGKDRIRYSLNLLNHALRFAPEWTTLVQSVQSTQAEQPLEATLRLLAILHIIQSNDFLTLKFQNNERILALSLKDIQSRPQDSAGAAAKWLKLDINAGDIAARYKAVSGLHAKSLEPRGFNLAMEATLNDNISSKYAEPLARIQSWAEEQRKNCA